MSNKTCHIAEWNTESIDEYKKTALRLIEIADIVWKNDFVSPDDSILTKDILLVLEPSEKAIKGWLSVREKFGHSALGLLVYDKDNEIIGYALSYSFKRSTKIGVMYLLPQYRRMGIGKELMDKIKEWSDPNKVLWLETITYNHPAIKFYKAQGFKRTRRKVDPYKLKCGKEIPNIEMVYVR